MKAAVFAVLFALSSCFHPGGTGLATIQALPDRSASETVIWQAGSPTIGFWEPATSGQCSQYPPLESKARFTFPITPQAGVCYRNQANPTTDAQHTTLVLLNVGQLYTWTWREKDAPAPGMGEPAGGISDSLVWQIHSPSETGTPCTRLGFQDVSYGPPSGQQWVLWTCSAGNDSHVVWSGPYKPGESDAWQVQAYISNGTDGAVTLWRNGVNQGTFNGATVNGSDKPFWNFGPYIWRWQLSGGGGDLRTSVNQTLSGMKLTTP